MSNNVVSQQLMIPSSQMSRLEPISSRLDSSMQMGPGISDFSHQQFSMPNTQIGSFGSGSTNLASQQLLVPNIQTGQSESLSPNLGFHNFPMSNNMNMVQMGSQGFNVVTQQILLPNQQSLEMETMLNNVGSHQLSTLNKRKAPMEPTSINTMPQNLPMPNKRVAQMEHRPWLQQIPPTSQRAGQMQSTPLGSQNMQATQRKMARTESMPRKSGPVSKSQTAQMQPSPKGRTDLSEPVRSKMREQLAAALALVSQQQDKPQTLEKRTQNEASSMQATADATDDVSEESKGALTSKENYPAQKGIDDQSASQKSFANESTGDTTHFSKFDGLEFQSSIVLPDEDVSFSDSLFARDELLQGNGLSWVMDPDKEVAEKHEIQNAGNQDQKKVGEGEGGLQFQSPLILASKIEAELFKLFGGVNKKYKEKGRSLLFNLKDRNNPELRERVLSGDIPPERLCNMTAEELASKELSQWRQAKAEELASMVVLPDSEVDVKRLVKKTHKGEFQVEFEPQGNPVEDVSVGPTIILPKKKEKETKTKKKEATVKENKAVLRPRPDGIKAKVDTASEKNNSKGKEDPCTLMIPSNDGSDLMQGLMVDDSLKDLPPIVSLDEFMESLNSEPPFENLPDAKTSTHTTDHDESEGGSQTVSADVTSQNPDDTLRDKVSNTNESNSVAATKSTDSSVKLETTSPVATTKGEHVWEGLLQLNISAVTSVIGIFKSGEKTSAKEWPSLIEIKGRVRLDAFQKFLQELPMSRSRAIMVLHFCCKEASSESERENVHEVADSYISDGRVGFAEPAPGMELYLCPPHTNTLDMLFKVLANDQVEALNAIDNGLIGVIVWRKPHLTSTISPKHTSKRQQHSTSSSFRRHQEKDTNNTTNIKQQSMHQVGGRHSFPSSTPNEDDDDDDVPPGFGPGVVAQDDDDLPEFNFSGGGSNAGPPPGYSKQNIHMRPGMAAPFRSHAQTTTRPVDQVRELIQKYGQSNSSPSPRNWQDKRGTGLSVQPWNDDDDDDIPEWQPNAPQHPPSAPVHGVTQPVLRAHMVSQVPGQQQQLAHQQPTTMHMQPPVNAMQGQQQRTWWAPPGSHGGQFYGAPGLGGAGRPGGSGVTWRQDAPKSRGF